ALAPFQIEQPLVAHEPEGIAELGVDLPEDRLAAAQEVLGPVELRQRRAPQWIDVEVPRSQRLQTEEPLPLLYHPFGQGHEAGLDRLVEAPAVLRAVIEPLARPERVVPERVEARVARDPQP